MTADKGGRRENKIENRDKTHKDRLLQSFFAKDAREPRKRKEEKEKPFRPFTLDIFLFLVVGILGKEPVMRYPSAGAPSTGARTHEAGKAPGRRDPGEDSRGAGDDDHRRGHRSCTDPGEGSPEGRRGTGHPRTGAGAGSRPWAAVRGAEANGSLPSCHHNSPGGGAGCAHGSHPDIHPGGGCTHAAGRAGRSRPRQADGGGAESASGPGRSWGRRAGSVGLLAGRTGSKVKKVRTLATQVTRTFLNSRLSSFSTAVLRSAAVSNSTKLKRLESASCLTRL